MGASCTDDYRTSNCNLDNRSASVNFYPKEFTRCHEWNPLILALRKFLTCERGNVESAMVLIPLLFLFLCGAQLTSAVFIRNFEMAKVQSEASTRAISNEFLPTDSIVSVGSQYSLDRPKLVVVRREQEIPIMVPGLSRILGGGLISSVTGVAVLESSH